MKKLLILFVMAATIGLASQAAGQKPQTKTVCFKSSMDCQNCQNKLTEYLKFEKGVTDLKVDLASNTVKLVYKEGKNSDETLAKAIEKKGYKAEKISVEEYDKLMHESAKPAK